MPMPGVGAGYHPNLLTLVNKARIEGLTQQQAFDKIREATPSGGRTVPDSEIWDTVRKGFSTAYVTPVKKFTQIEIDQNIQKVLGPKDTWPVIDDILLAPKNLHQSRQLTTKACLTALYEPEDKIFIGGCMDNKPSCIQPVTKYTNKEVWNFGNYMVANPLSGDTHVCKDGVTKSYRCDAAVNKFKYCIVEFDTIPEDVQVAIYGKLKLPIVMLVHSGGKSIHAWLRVDASTHNEWQTKVNDWYTNIFSFIGADMTCRNVSRLTRTPGVEREISNGPEPEDIQKVEQTCIYLRPDAPEGQAIV